MLSAFRSALTTPDLRKKILFTLAMVAVYRLGAAIPSPGVSYPNVQECIRQVEGGENSSVYSLINLFSGGALLQLSIFALGIMPYITASIIVQLLTVVIPRFEQLKKEGQSGQNKLTQYTRYLTIALAILQSTGIVALADRGQLFGNCSEPVIPDSSIFILSIIVITMTAGTAVIMWLGEQVTERGIGNGVSLIIFAGIVAGLPSAVIQTVQAYQNGSLNFLSLLLIVVVVLGFTWFVVFVERGQRRITVNYARRQGGRNAYMNQTSFLPLKLNMSGVIPAIFASSILAFPATLSMWSGQATQATWLQRVSNALAPGEPLHMIVFAALITGFAFFYTALVFNSQETADNLKKSGALIPGIRPGKATADYIDGVLTRLTAAGAAYLVIVCLLPEVMRTQLNTSFYFGGTSLLIVVVVVMDFIAQIQAHLMSHQYESLLKKANLKGGSRGGLARG